MLKTLPKILCMLSAAAAGCFGVSAQSSGTHNVSATSLDAEVREFTAREVAAHFGNIKAFNPPPQRVFNALTVGDFSWGSFARALAAEADISGSRTIAGRDTARAIAEMGLIEARSGGKAFSQLYATLALRHYGTDLSKNAVWQSMTESERDEYRQLLDPSRFYDARKRQVINLPENYLGVAVRIAAVSWEMGVLKDRELLDSVIERAAEQFTSGKIYSDDNPPTGRYDRYSNEYARFCWDAARIGGRRDILEKLKPSLRAQMRLWWDLVSPAGYGYNWGRSQGLVSYLDTMEIVAFLAENPEFRPAPLAELAALYNQAWRWIRADYDDATHMFRVFDYGRGNYSYINPSREWQQTGTAFGKIILASRAFNRSLEREGIKEFPVAPALPDVARFEYFEKRPGREFGVWLVRRGRFQFALPFTTGTKPGVADYLPAPFGMPGFAAPVEEVCPSLVPFLELTDGKTYAAGEGADSVTPSADGQAVKAVWTKWAQIGSRSGQTFANGLRSEVTFILDGKRLTRRETVTAESDVHIRRWRVAVPSTADTFREVSPGNYVFTGRQGSLAVRANTARNVSSRIVASGNSRLSKGPLGAIPLHLILDTADVPLGKGEQWSWEISFELPE
jgi:hypothetical protein